MTLRLEPRDFVAAGLYGSEEAVVQEALRHLLEDRADLRIPLAVHRYDTDETLTLATAAALAGVSLWRMTEILDEHGIALRLGPTTVEEARAELATLKRLRDARAD